jgi:hypothetical protein
MLCAMGALKRPTLWLALAIAAMLAGYAEIDLRLLAAALCGIAVLAGAGAFDRRGRELEP